MDAPGNWSICLGFLGGVRRNDEPKEGMEILMAGKVLMMKNLKISFLYQLELIDKKQGLGQM